MSLRKVMSWGMNRLKYVLVDDEATKGAVVESNLEWPDGKIVQESEIRNPPTPAEGLAGDDGLPGAAGADGSAGIDARAVNLTMVDQTIEYDTNGATPNPATVVVTATALNTTGTVYFEFFLNDVSVQNTTAATYTYTSPSSYASMPEKLEVQIREGASTGPILARDQMTVSGLKAGTDAITVIVENEAHTLPTTNAGVVTYTGSGTDFEVWEGTTQLPYGTGTPGYTISAVGTNITPNASPTTVSTYTRRYGNHNSMVADNAAIAYTITVKNAAGVTTIFPKKQSFAKSIQGTDGAIGADGPTGPDGTDSVGASLTLPSPMIPTASDGTGYATATLYSATYVVTGSDGVDQVVEGSVDLTGTIPATITATTISAAAADNSYNDSGNGFITAGFKVGDVVTISGFTGNTANNILDAIITAVTAGKITIGGTDGNVIVNDAAGESVTITHHLYRIVGGATSGTDHTLTQNGAIFVIQKVTGIYYVRTPSSSSAWTSDSETFTVRATYKGVDYDRVYTITKAKAGAGAATARVKLNTGYESSLNFGATATIKYQIANDGNEKKSLNGGALSNIGAWKLTGVVGDYNYRAVNQTGTFLSGTFNTWINGGTTGSWEVQDAASGSPIGVTGTMTMEFEDATTKEFLTSRVVVLYSEWTP